MVEGKKRSNGVFLDLSHPRSIKVKKPMLLAHICSALCRVRLKIRTGKNILRQGSTLSWPLNWGTAYKSSSENVESVTKASKNAENVTNLS